jgi:hypothetical protein
MHKWACWPFLIASAALATPQGAIWSVRIEKKIGSIEAAEYTFSRIEDLVASPSGQIFVLQHEEATVKQYDSRGRFQRRLGRRGAGPGEFGLPTRLWWVGSELWVLDQAYSRFNRFDENGAFRSSVTLVNLGLRIPAQHVELGTGNTLFATRRIDTSSLLAGKALTPLLHIRSNDLDTVTTLNFKNSIIGIRSADGRGVTVRRNPFADHDLFVVLRPQQNIVVLNRSATTGSKPTLTWFSFAGDRLRSLTLIFRAAESCARRS